MIQTELEMTTIDAAAYKADLDRRIAERREQERLEREAYRVAADRCRDLEPPGVDPDDRSAAFLMDYWAERDGLTPDRVAGIVANVWPHRDAFA